MIKKIVLLFVLSALFVPISYAQEVSTHEIQRAKINALLAERSAKFGQYDASLNARTGIFGLQTKRDIRNSNEILRQIVLNDNEVFTQLKVLMDYKDLEVEQIKTVASTNSENILNYRKTIKSLQDQNQSLTENQDKIESSRDLAYLFMSIFVIACSVLSYLLFNKMKKNKKDEKASIQIIK
jgi:hypothetical protein